MANQSNPVLETQQRVVRVFISSTFRDMQAEREELVKRTFPQLRKLCDQRGVVWGEVDLRWGITPEEAERGEVLPICLAEIERCRPYFIGLLGERYGWVPDEINPELSEREEWLRDNAGYSVTELEILHGVLNDPTMAHNAFFYFRDPSFVEKLPTEKRSEFVESPGSTEIASYGAEEAERRADGRRQKLRALKDRIRHSNLPLRTNYKDAVALGQMVLKDMTDVINRLYPEGSAPDPLDREIAEHHAFAQSRAHVYIKREADLERLNAHAAGDEPPLVVLGESGVGKSALLANWALDYRKQHPDTPLVFHSIGASSESADWGAMTRRIIGELNRTLHFDQAIPDDAEQLRRAFASTLNAASEQRRFVLVLDGLNQLVDKDGALDLVWLPAQLPASARVFLSTLPGRPLDEIQKRDWPSFEVAALRAPERRKLIGDYLAQYTKKLNPDQVAKIAGARQTGNPLYMRALLEELRVFGEHERLAERIDHYLSARSVPTLYQKILERYEHDYDRDRPELTREAMSLLWAARRGLAESELMDLLGPRGEPLPRAYWSPLFLAAEQGFVSRDGLLNFSHDYFRQAVGSRYLSRKPQRKEAHLRLADYFAGREINQRRVDEQPWQLARAEEWTRLQYLVSDLSFFDAAWKRSHSEVKAFWTQIEAHSDHRLANAFKPLLDRLVSSTRPYVPLGWQPTLQMAQVMPEAPPDENKLWSVSELLFDRGHSKEAMRIRDWLKDRFEATGDRSSLSAALGGKALILRARGELDEAYDLFKQQEDIGRETGKKDSLIGALIGQAQILEDKGRLDDAIRLCIEAESVSVESGNRLGLTAAIGNRASILYLRGQDDEALSLYKQQERIARELDDQEGLYVALGNQGLLLEAKKRPQDALVLFKQGESIARELGNRKGVAASLGYQARLLAERGEYETAGGLLDEKEHICKELGDQAGLATLLQLRGEIARKTGDRLLALECYREEERIARQFDYQFALYNSLTGQARMHQEAGRHDLALYSLNEAEGLARESPLQLSSVLRQQSLVMKDQRAFDDALGKLAEADRVCVEAGNQRELLEVLSTMIAVHMERNDFPRALQVLKREEPIAVALSDAKSIEICRLGIPSCLGILGDHHAENGRPDEAQQCYSELEARAREMGDRQQLQRSLEGQADLFVRSGAVLKALTKLEESEQMDRSAGDQRLLAGGLLKQATILIDAGLELDKARSKAEEAETIYYELGMNLQSAAAGAMLLRIRSGLSGSVVKFVGAGVMLLLAAGGVALGLWKTWLWIIGGPLVLFAAINLVLTMVPSLQQRYNDYVKRKMAATSR